MECLDGGASVSVNSTSSYDRVGSTCCYFLMNTSLESVELFLYVQ